MHKFEQLPTTTLDVCPQVNVAHGFKISMVFCNLLPDRLIRSIIASSNRALFTERITSFVRVSMNERGGSARISDATVQTNSLGRWLMIPEINDFGGFPAQFNFPITLFAKPI